jgi:hypothetical protein
MLRAPAPQMSYGENYDPVRGVAIPSPIATGTSGSLYGPSNLLGEISPALLVSGGDSAVVSDHPLVNGSRS